MIFFKKATSATVFFGLLLATSAAFGHALWVNLYESTGHPPGHILAYIGWGHRLPADDLLGSHNGRIQLESYSVFDPEMNRITLPVPKTQPPDILQQTKNGIRVETGELGLIRIPFDEKMPEGTYQVVVESKENYFTIYRNREGKRKMAPKAIHAISDASEILSSMQFKMTGKSYFSRGDWQPPQPAGFKLEVLPTTDITRLHVGEMVTFDAKFMGEPLNTGASGLYTMTLSSNSFGGPDGFHLGAYVRNGKSSFRIPAAGQWMANLYVRQNVADNPELHQLTDTCKTIFYGSSIAFEVMP